MKTLITQRRIYDEIRGNTDSLEDNYIKYFEGFGCELIPLPISTRNLDQYLTTFGVQRIIFTGGNDVDPKLYGESDETLDVFPERDEIEQKLLTLAIAHKIPCLFICRGMQFFNVFFGGKVQRDIGSENHVKKDHIVNIVEDKLMQLLDAKEINVNSYHNHGFKESHLANELKPFAIAEDAIIEGIFHPTLPLAGMEWHPERESPDEKSNKKLINAFVKRELFWK